MNEIRFIPKRIVDSCSDCPCCEFESNDCEPSGYYCKELNRMIIKYTWFRDKPEEVKKILAKFPDWCPLEKEE